MRKINALRAAKTKPELALLLGVKATALTYVLYVLKPDTQYSTFTIPKKSGGLRTICSPSDRLKTIQSALSELLQDCLDELTAVKVKENHDYKSNLSHGFLRNKSIITNAIVHTGQRNVLNLDLKDFFDKFNFGRVRGFFISNKDFQLNEHIATVIAQIACYDNRLPQGSPCSPVITNLITHILDIKLAALAESYSCIYSRYADDITFSTRERLFPPKLMKEIAGEYIPGKKLRSEIRRAGFEINAPKTRIQFQDSRQDVTGLVVNKKPNVKSEYWRTVKSQCHSLFRTGSFKKKVDGTFADGNIYELEGQLNFIDQVDYSNRLRQKPPLDTEYEQRKSNIKTRELLSGRETTFSRFLYYKFFYANEKPTIICEGKTDNIYLKSAISSLAANYPKLATPKSANNPYELLVKFFNYNNRTRFLLQLHGGTNYLHTFINDFESHYDFYKAPRPKQPIIIILDNDSGFNGIDGLLKGKASAKRYPVAKGKKKDFRNANFIHVAHNLYIVLTPPTATGGHTAIESLFTAATLNEKVQKKTFNPESKINTTTEYGKEIFAKKVILANKKTINFSGFDVILKRVIQCMKHYETAK
ncbi:MULTISPECIES: retron Ec67 family RNA-directed DNA polymerase/endonuclease [unclassified Pseudomonas]|uniref:retron Ec67 family RNA-directed DNA polymerase/endonuclease n=1 Tax=unclassified Pseudomonas TaxID=196821 RepID=UPI000C86D0F6|nr:MULTISPECIES: retron Ec67 family RNA-directed DNA polymerase/endonuclease [unclassified Pseudomonas]PMV27283.1 ribonuclease H [Pseudomonas sp. FW305-3-2-15-C-TSA2]PMV32538.1 ribonuclease H [Pseudomonas sp. DP16D-L5]PMV42252.1 ribonuclease H [Pseudomonas sp. FW305-3-2-15-A-LB2]PMV49708.1 ribonuclease H [Pseudomonas sp. FW305-3-2-15-C-R2A1]PMV55176.1 ribonuclease H [Pseudomonas sp. FW305-3-2-15-C-LB1]